MLIAIGEKTYRRASQLFIAVLAVIVFLTFRHYGVSWDEEIQSQYGQAIYDFYNSGFVDHRYNQIFNLYLYGGMFDGLAALFEAYSPFGIYATRHLLNALVGLLGLWGAWRLGRLIGGGQVGFVTLVLLALTPMYYGHIFNNPKDIPFAVGVVWTLYYMTKSLRAFPDVPKRLIVVLGLVLGLTLGVRVGGVMLLGYWGVSLVFYAASIWLNEKPSLLFLFLRLVRLAVPVVVIAYAVMLFCWPWAQEAPIANPIKAFIQFSHFPQNVEVLLDGVTYMSTELPWYYVPLYFAVQLPLPQLFLTLSGIALLPLIWRDLESKANRYAFMMVLLTAFAPVFFAVTRHPALYDAVRHFIFILPLLCVLAALAIKQILKYGLHGLVKIRSHNVRQLTVIMFVAGLAAVMTAQIVPMVRLHPYEYIYINPLAGGVKGGYGHYELDYWGSSFKEAAEKLQAYVNKEGGVPAGEIYRIAICGPWSAATIYLPPYYQPVVANETAEFFLSTTRWKCQNMRPGKEIIRVTRMGAPLSIVEDLRGQKDYKPDEP
ncbi:MAG: glycosyltransferase family 39 protein [Alphaproteobacteria bacterium]|nr:glycosyltransferase family 39 protein [Alphaproteobacteria bacterium]